MPHLAGGLRFIEQTMNSYSQVPGGVYYFPGVIKYPNKSDLRKEGFMLGYSSKEYTPSQWGSHGGRIATGSQDVHGTEVACSP